MENLTAYLDESLVPLEQKVKEYLEIEREITLLEVKIINQQTKMAASDDTDHKESPAESAQPQESDLGNKEQMLEELLQRYNEKKKELINMLPEQNKFIEVNLGYGPSMIGYFTTDLETHQELNEPILRIVH
ncbi:hypothetical protein ACSX1A_10195 [Pontibacter sp. MBLB2868]|uniref:hypothetical protein n=1 Tax=Pontibacter sp. MBLB2868 TaxID=3451555 RepID=UPI003F750BAF